MNDKLELRYVDSPRCQVGSQEYLMGSISEFDQGAFPICLLHTSVKNPVRNPVLAQKVTHSLDGILEVAENDPVLITQVRNQVQQGFKLVFGGRKDLFDLKLGNFVLQKIHGDR